MEYKVMNCDQLFAKCEDLETAVMLIRTLEVDIDRDTDHSPFTILPVEIEEEVSVEVA